MSNRAWLISMRQSATVWRTTPCSASGLAEGDARAGARAQRLERALGLADRAHAVVDAAGPTEPPLRDLEAAPLAQQGCSAWARARR